MTRSLSRSQTLIWSLAAGLFLLAPPSGANPPEEVPRSATPPAKPAAEPAVTAVPEEVVKQFNLDTTFYKKHVDYKGFSILSSAKVSDTALLEARYLIDQLLGEREDLLQAMIKAGCRFMVMAPTEMTTDVPEQRHWNKEYWDRRARGMGGKLSSCGEENLLNLKGDRYNRENILIHEFNHAIHQRGLRTVDPTFDGRLRETYKKAMARELWKGTYSATNPSEYWAEGVQAYFDCMRPQYGANTREKLQKYDPDLFALVDEVYKQSKFRYVRYDRRHPPEPKKDPPTPNPTEGQPGAKKPGREAAPPRVPRVVRVTPPEATGAVEVSVAINPTNPDHLIAASIARVREHPGITDFAYVSGDAGRTWKMVPRANPHRVQQGDDVVAFTPSGVAVHAFISFTGIRQSRPRRAHSGIVTSTSRDGLTWEAQVPVVEHFNSVEPHEDKPWVKADVSPDSPHRGNLYVAWTRFDVYGSSQPEHKSHVYFSRSVDSGRSFAVPRKISDQPGDARDKSDTLMGACPGVGPNGEVYVVWAGPRSLFFAQSTDAGVSFGKSTVLGDCAGWDFPVAGLGRASGYPSLGVDVTKGRDRGSVYVCWADTRNGDPDVFLLASRDGGATWGEPLRVNHDAQGNGKEQWFPWLVVDPVDGSVNIACYDRGAQAGTRTDLTLARSVDGGRTFVHHKLNEESYDLSKLGFFGDYLGLDCHCGRVAVLWMHPVDNSKKLGISSAMLDFEPGTQEARGEQ